MWALAAAPCRGRHFPSHNLSARTSRLPVVKSSTARDPLLMELTPESTPTPRRVIRLVPSEFRNCPQAPELLGRSAFAALLTRPLPRSKLSAQKMFVLPSVLVITCPF